jgi:hypothetical protein
MSLMRRLLRGQIAPPFLVCPWCGNEHVPRRGPVLFHRTEPRPPESQLSQLGFCSRRHRIKFRDTAHRWAIDALDSGLLTREELLAEGAAESVLLRILAIDQAPTVAAAQSSEPPFEVSTFANTNDLAELLSAGARRPHYSV